MKLLPALMASALLITVSARAEAYSSPTAVATPAATASPATAWQGHMYTCWADPPLADEKDQVPGGAQLLAAVAPQVDIDHPVHDLQMVDAYPYLSNTEQHFDRTHKYRCQIGGNWDAAGAPREWIWINWSDYSNYQAHAGVVTVYDDPAGVPGGSTSVTVGGGGTSVAVDCRSSYAYQHMTSIQAYLTGSRSCLDQAYNAGRCLYVETTGDLTMNVDYGTRNNQGQLCTQVYSGASEITVYRNGSICAGACYGGAI